MKELIQFIKLELQGKGLRFELLFQIRDYFKAKYSYHYSWYSYQDLEGNLVGFCIMYNRTIYRIYVHEAYRNNDIGSKLIPDYANYVKASKKAVKFYEKQGFKVNRVNKKNVSMIR